MSWTFIAFFCNSFNFMRHFDVLVLHMNVYRLKKVSILWGAVIPAAKAHMTFKIKLQSSVGINFIIFLVYGIGKLKWQLNHMLGQ